MPLTLSCSPLLTDVALILDSFDVSRALAPFRQKEWRVFSLALAMVLVTRGLGGDVDFRYGVGEAAVQRLSDALNTPGHTGGQGVAPSASEPQQPGQAQVDGVGRLLGSMGLCFAELRLLCDAFDSMGAEAGEGKVGDDAVFAGAEDVFVEDGDEGSDGCAAGADVLASGAT